MSGRIVPGMPGLPAPFGSVSGPLADGAAVVNGVEASIIIPTGSHTGGRVRFKASVAGSLRAVPVRADPVNTEYATKPASAASPLAIVANTEAVLELDQLAGEGLVKLGFTPAADGTVTYCDRMIPA